MTTLVISAIVLAILAVAFLLPPVESKHTEKKKDESINKYIDKYDANWLEQMGDEKDRDKK